MRKLFTFEKFKLDESTQLSESDDYYAKNGYIEDPSIDSKETLLAKIEKEINPAFQEFIKLHKIPMTGAVISVTEGRRPGIDLKTDQIPDDQRGVFGAALDSCSFVFFSGREINCAEENGKFMFIPTIWSTLNLSYSSKSGGSNGMNYHFSNSSGNRGRGSDLWYDILNQKFLDADAKMKTEEV